jgi:hypothetical protein
MRSFFCLGLVFGVFSTLVPAACAQEDARSLVARAIKAQGGTEKLDKIQADRVQVKGTIYLGETGAPFSGETLVRLPDKFKNVMNLKYNGQAHNVVQVLNGENAWIRIDGRTSEPDASILSVMKERMYIDRLIRLTPLLKDKQLELSPLKEIKVNDHPAAGVKIASRGQRDVNLYFDKENGFLVKAEYRTLNNQKREVLQEDYFSDYKEVGGFKRPMKLLAFQDGKKLMEAEITDAKYPEKIPDAEFARP